LSENISINKTLRNGSSSAFYHFTKAYPLSNVLGVPDGDKRSPTVGLKNVINYFIRLRSFPEVRDLIPPTGRPPPTSEDVGELKSPDFPEDFRVPDGNA